MDMTPYSIASPLEEFTRDHDFWLEDGSVILVAKKTAFKVYKGLLSAHSPVFSDMFLSATRADETYDSGCPVVRIPESPEDLKWVLTHLIQKTLGHLEANHECHYPELSALARLGHKYQIDQLERHAISRLMSVFPNDIEQWEDLVQSSQVLRSPGYLSYNPIDIIDIARLTDTPSMLPLAFFLCVQNEAIIIDGQAREDGTRLVLGKADAKRFSGFRDLYRTSERAVQQTILLTTSQSSCATPTVCRSGLDAMLDTACQGGSLYPIEALHDVFFLSFAGCSTCSQAIKRFCQDERRELWKKLPQIFGLQDELKGHWPGY